MRWDIMEKETKYNCIIQELEKAELKELERIIKQNPKLRRTPWIRYFIERFHLLARDNQFSKRAISKECSKIASSKKLLDDTTPLPESTLAEITNPRSKNLHVPSASNLILLSQCFNVSIDYLVGKTNCLHPENEDTHNITGLLENSIDALRLKKILFDKPIFTKIFDFPLNENNCLDVTKLPDSKKNIQLYYSNISYQYKKLGKIETKNKKAMISEINSIMDRFPKIFKSQENKLSDNDYILTK